MHADAMQLLLEMVGKLVGCGAIHGLTDTSYHMNELRAVMGIMGAGRHTGKIVCCLPPDVSVSCAWSVSGGLGALGALSASWLGLRGASGVQLLGRAGHSRRPEQDVPAQLKGAGFVTRAARCDMSCLEEVAFAVGGPGLGAERGLLHAGGLLRDAPVGLQTAGGFRAVLGLSLIHI